MWRKDYMLYEETEMERIVAAAMGSDDCRAEIESIKAEAGNATGTSSDGTQKPSRLGTSKSDDVEASADASVTENDDDSEDKDRFSSRMLGYCKLMTDRE